ncbi:MAG: hypothetical protein HQK78_12085 [Desulfobacterales bacterium]|nr:hypothetical protein [Desulfobacterales bacterium]
MSKQEIIKDSPLKYVGYIEREIFKEASFKAVLSQPGTGKTAFLVQIALYNMLNDKNVIHISLNNSVNKVALWYDEVFYNILNHAGKAKENNKIIEDILPHRLIMTFGDFHASKIKEALLNLKAQNIFFPKMILIDGVLPSSGIIQELINLKEIVSNFSIDTWISIRENGLFNKGIIEPFDCAIELNATNKDINMSILKGKEVTIPLKLELSTFILKNN